MLRESLEQLWVTAVAAWTRALVSQAVLRDNVTAVRNSNFRSLLLFFLVVRSGLDICLLEQGRCVQIGESLPFAIAEAELKASEGL